MTAQDAAAANETSNVRREITTHTLAIREL